MVLAADEPGATGKVESQDSEKSVILKIPHFPHLFTIKPEDLQDKFVFGSGRQQLKAVDQASGEALARVHGHYDQTAEFLKMMALQGKLVDGKGRVLYDFHEVFGIIRPEFDFALGTETTDIREICAAILQNATDNADGEPVDGAKAYVAQAFFSRLTRHPMVEKYYVNWQNAQALAGQESTRTFKFEGVLFEVYEGSATGVDGLTRRYVPANEGVGFPLGTMNVFKRYLGPPHHIDYVNTVGPEIFVSPKVLDHGKGIELQCQANWLVINQRPDLTFKVFSSN